jgi:hypothetical protein
VLVDHCLAACNALHIHASRQHRHCLDLRMDGEMALFVVSYSAAVDAKVFDGTLSLLVIFVVGNPSVHDMHSVFGALPIPLQCMKYPVLDPAAIVQLLHVSNVSSAIHHLRTDDEGRSSFRKFVRCPDSAVGAIVRLGQAAASVLPDFKYLVFCKSLKAITEIILSVRFLANPNLGALICEGASEICRFVKSGKLFGLHD